MGFIFSTKIGALCNKTGLKRGAPQSLRLRQMFTGAFDFSVPAVAWPKNPVLSSSLLLRWELQFFWVNFSNWIDSEIEVVKSGSRKFQTSFSSLVLRWEVQTFFSRSSPKENHHGCKWAFILRDPSRNGTGTQIMHCEVSIAKYCTSWFCLIFHYTGVSFDFQ